MLKEAPTPASCWACSSPASRGCLRTLWRGKLLGGEGLDDGMAGREGGWMGGIGTGLGGGMGGIG